MTNRCKFSGLGSVGTQEGRNTRRRGRCSDRAAGTRDVRSHIRQHLSQKRKHQVVQSTDLHCARVQVRFALAHGDLPAGSSPGRPGAPENPRGPTSPVSPEQHKHPIESFWYLLVTHTHTHTHTPHTHTHTHTHMLSCDAYLQTNLAQSL